MRFADLEAPGPELKIALSRLHSELLHRAKQPPSTEATAFFSSAVTALGNIRGGSNLMARIECLYHCVCYLYHNGSDSAALAAIGKLDQLASRNYDTTWARRIAMLGGVMYSEIGDIPEGLARYSNSLRIARQANDIFGEVATLGNLGAALNYAGLFNEAIACLTRAIALATTDRCIEATLEQGFERSYFECTALSNIAQSYHYIEDNEKALRAITRCLESMEEPADPPKITVRIIREFIYVRIALDLGMTLEACEHTQRCVQYSALAGSRARLLTSICQGLCEVRTGDVAKGLAILNRALEDSEVSASTRTDALLALASATNEMNQPAAALVYIERVLVQIRESRQKTITALLSMTELDAHGTLTSESNDLRKLRLVQATLSAKAAEQKAYDAQIETLERLAVTADIKEDASGGHGYRVGRLASLFAHELDWTKDRRHAIELAGRLHDIGKIGLPDRLLLKSDHFREMERKFVASHTRIGAEILSQGRSEILRVAQEVALHHHEHWDGSGYPSALAEHRIPVSARIVALADVFDALTHGRPYSQAWSVEQALAELKLRLGSQFDPVIGDQFIDFLGRLIARHPDLDEIFTEARRRIQVLVEDGNRCLSGESAALAD